MASLIAIEDDGWALVQNLFDRPRRPGAPVRYDRREIVDAILFLARTGCQWRYLPDRYPPWEVVWQQWRRWRDSGVWEKAMARLAHVIRARHKRKQQPSVVMIDAQTVRGGRFGPTFHNAGGRGGRTVGAKRSILIEILGLPGGLPELRESRLEFHRDRATRGVANEIGVEVVHDRKQPRSHVGAGAPKMEPAPGAREHVLQQVLGGVAIAQQRARIAAQMRDLLDEQALFGTVAHATGTSVRRPVAGNQHHW